jgi:hypothetical protein
VKKNNAEYEDYKREVFKFLDLGASRENISNLLEIHIKSVEYFFDLWAFENKKRC